MNIVTTVLIVLVMIMGVMLIRNQEQITRLATENSESINTNTENIDTNTEDINVLETEVFPTVENKTTTELEQLYIQRFGGLPPNWSALSTDYQRELLIKELTK